ncbi:hypothetical protein A3Q56_03505 [Intoshia linei]|uniref:Uncharacterized protein n=1 Tax=Intoshia linei TaxID=1819745 RepID=A0A177B5Q0_9BILA|nr:hypothetical protein A3Q56_03505 [Intoshia linei]
MLNFKSTSLTWSVSRNSSNPNAKLYVTKSRLSTKNWTDAYQWVQKQNTIIMSHDQYYVLTGNDVNLTRDQASQYVDSIN